MSNRFHVMWTSARDADGKEFNVRVEIDYDRLAQYARKAIENKSGRAVVGPVVLTKGMEQP